jgi:hypothetical protein
LPAGRIIATAGMAETQAKRCVRFKLSSRTLRIQYPCPKDMELH